MIIFILHWFYLSSQVVLAGYFLLYTVTDQDIIVLVPGGRKRTQYMRGRHWGHHQKRLERRLFLLFLDNLAVVLGILTFQDKHNIGTYVQILKQNMFIYAKCRQYTGMHGKCHIYLHPLRNGSEKFVKGLLCLLDSKAGTNKFYIYFDDNVRKV